MHIASYTKRRVLCKTNNQKEEDQNLWDLNLVHAICYPKKEPLNHKTSWPAYFSMPQGREEIPVEIKKNLAHVYAMLPMCRFFAIVENPSIAWLYRVRLGPSWWLGLTVAWIFRPGEKISRAARAWPAGRPETVNTSNIEA